MLVRILSIQFLGIVRCNPDLSDQGPDHHFSGHPGIDAHSYQSAHRNEVHSTRERQFPIPQALRFCARNTLARAAIWLIKMKKVEIEIPESCDTCESNNYSISGTMKNGVLNMRVSCMRCKVPHNFKPIITEHE